MTESSLPKPATSALSVSVSDLSFDYGPGSFSLAVPRLEIAAGESVAFVGPSGSGKTTLLHLIAGILVPRRGEVRIGDDPISSFDDRRRRRFRALRIGLVFQEFELLDYLDVRENILLPFRLRPGAPLDDARKKAETLALSVGLGDRLEAHPPKLSPGEKQRVAICRALVTDPGLVLADEPTSSLDAETGWRVLDLCFSALRESGATLLALTHDASSLARFDRVLRVPGLEELER
ncbi:MAG TPA: ATP-binding cassette domain-containing protein [Planctomycetota bacterium]|nr:ATP-binding cassette domain-containing protein [Planctomycetota bacterium]